MRRRSRMKSLKILHPLSQGNIRDFFLLLYFINQPIINHNIYILNSLAPKTSHALQINKYQKLTDAFV